MKNILVLGLVMLTVLFSSCDREKPSKDVENSINKLNYFNETFAEYYQDGVISKENTLGARMDKSEYDNLKTIAAEYYELINKINSNISEEAELAAEGKKIDNYEVDYQKEISSRSADIEAATILFHENLAIIKASDSN